MVRTKDVVLMATVSSFESMTQPGRHELKQFSELFEPVFKASSIEARRNAVAALARCPMVPKAVAWFVGTQPIAIAAIFLTRSPAIDDETLIAIARTQGPAHARAIAARENLSVKVVDALVSMHQGQGGGRLTALPETSTGPAGNIAEREEEMRRRLKSLVQRETIARAEEHPESQAELRQALLVRFARLREARHFSTTLADCLGSSLWLTNRILLDLSGLQLASALIAIGTDIADGIFILQQFYPHLAARSDDTSRAEMLWFGLEAEECRDRVRTWIRADDYTQGKPSDEAAANANAATTALAARRPAYGHARGGARR
jgi:uncharacterized protein (DUF2336 family)